MTISHGFMVPFIFKFYIFHHLLLNDSVFWQMRIREIKNSDAMWQLDPKADGVLYIFV